MRARSKPQGLRLGHTRCSALRYALSLALAAAPLVAAGQAADSTGETGGLQEIVVTATRHEESLSKVPISITALTQENMDIRGIKDILDVARFTPGLNVDNSGTSNISIRGIASTGGAGTTGIYIDDTPIQMRALAFNPDETLPKSFDMDRVEVLRGPQGTLFGAGSEGGTVRYITTPPSLSKNSIYSRSELSFTQGGAASYEAGVAAGGPVVDGTLGVRATAWYRKDGGWIDRVDPTNNPPNVVLDKNANHDETLMLRLAAIWAPNEHLSFTPSMYYQDRKRHDVESYWPLYSNPNSDRFISANPTARPAPDKWYLPALKIQADFGAAQLISNTSYYHRDNQTGYDGTLYNLGFYQTFMAPSPYPLLDSNGVHLPASIANYRSPASVDNGQRNFTQEVRLQSSDAAARLIWTTGVFYGSNKQSYLEQIHDPMLPAFTLAVAGQSYLTLFGADFDPAYPTDSYFLRTNAKDEQLAWFGEGTYSFTEQWKATVGLRFSRTKFSFDTLTGGPQLFGPTVAGNGNQQENSSTPKLGLAYQHDDHNLYYATYAKGFRPGGANNPLPAVACAADFQNFGITASPTTFKSDTVDSYEVGAKNNFNNRVKIASSVYYIKWHSIQQTVIPPICQISFIDNLGEAIAKGADIQAEIAIGGSFSAEIAAGYTDARYTKDARLSATEVTPIVANGDAIVGQSTQPGSPFTAAVGLEYRFGVAEHEAFVRADYQYEGRSKWLGATQDPGSLQFNANNYTLAGTSFASLRGGVALGAWSVAAFVDNLTNNHVVTNYEFTINPNPPSRPLERDFTFRPRTIGITVTYRN
jgi:iron complex outermembrane receptor protein